MNTSPPYTIEYLVDSLKVTIPARQSAHFVRLAWWVVYQTFILGILSVLTILGIRDFTTQWKQPQTLILVLILIVALVPFGYRFLKGLNFLLSQVYGAETVRISLDGFTGTTRFIGIPRLFTVQAEGWVSITVTQPQEKEFWIGRHESRTFYIIEAGPLVYTSAGRQVRFGLGLKVSEALSLARQIRERFPSLFHGPLLDEKPLPR